jgi:hypothetical protein
MSVSVSGSTATVTGTITSGNKFEFVLNAGSGCGNVPILTNSATAWSTNGLSVTSGTAATVLGEGSCATSFTASSVTLGSGSSTPNLAGTINSTGTDTINVAGANGCGAVNVNYSSSTAITYNGNSLAKGVPISVWGSGSCATSFTATTITLGSGSSSASTTSMTHVLTADYLGGYSGTNTVTAAQAAPYLSWASTSTADSSGISKAGIKTMMYLSPTRQATTDPLYSSHAFAYACGGSTIAIPYNSTTTFYLMNPASTTLQSAMNAWAKNEQSEGHFDAFFLDDMDDLYSVPSTPCNVTSSEWDSENWTLISSFNYPVIFNGYAISSDSEALIGDSRVTGAMVEECYGRVSNPTPPYSTGSYWTEDENLQISAAKAGKMFFCYNNGAYASQSYIQLREYIYASFLLTYSPSSSVLWESLATTSGLHVFPETKLVPTSPYVAASTVSALETSSGLYAQEYAACYLAGQSVGPCAVVVNPNSSGSLAFPSLRHTYKHTMALSGEGVLDGGSVSVTGSAPPASVAPETGLVVLE